MKKKKVEKEKKLLEPMKWYEVGVENSEKVYILGNFTEANDQLEIWICYENERFNTMIACFKEWKYFIKLVKFDPKEATKGVILPENWGKIV